MTWLGLILWECLFLSLFPVSEPWEARNGRHTLSLVRCCRLVGSGRAICPGRSCPGAVACDGCHSPSFGHLCPHLGKEADLPVQSYMFPFRHQTGHNPGLPQ